MTSTSTTKRIYWHPELPPLSADPLGEDELTADSDVLAWTVDGADTLWQRAMPSLRAHAEARLLQELDRKGARFAQVVDEHVTEHRDLANNTWKLTGRFSWVAWR